MHQLNSNLIRQCTQCNWMKWPRKIHLVDHQSFNPIFAYSSHWPSSKMMTTRGWLSVNWQAMALKQVAVMKNASSCSSTTMRPLSCPRSTKTRHRVVTAAASSSNSTSTLDLLSSKRSSSTPALKNLTRESLLKYWAAGQTTLRRSSMTSQNHWPST